MARIIYIKFTKKLTKFVPQTFEPFFANSNKKF